MITREGKVIAYMLSENTTASNLSIISDKNNCVKIRADLQDTSEWNRNRRKYPMKTVKSGLYSERVQELIRMRSWCGEAGHPIEPTLQRQCNVVNDNISHRVLNFDIVGPIIKGDVKTTATPRGYDMRNFILDDDPMITAFSLRALGPMIQTAEGHIVQEPLTMICYDWVFYPSHRKAYQTEVLNKINESGNTVSLTESTLFPLLESSAIDYIKHDSKNFKLISPLFEYDNRSVSLSEDCKTVVITNNLSETATDKIIVGLEGYISNDINSYFNKFR
jgi:Prohead core protein protease.